MAYNGAKIRILVHFCLEDLWLRIFKALNMAPAPTLLTKSQHSVAATCPGFDFFLSEF